LSSVFSHGASKTQSIFSRAGINWPSGLRLQLLGWTLVAGSFLAGCRTPVQEENFSNAFDAQKVAQLSHEAYKVAFDVSFWARHDLRFAPFHPTVTDYEVVEYLNDITRQVPWIARKVERNPESPRISSKYSYDVVAYDVMMLRRRYEPKSFRPSTDAKIEYLLSLVDGIAPFYEQKSTSGKDTTQANAAPAGAPNAAAPSR
jgi:hypothetical protein